MKINASNALWLALSFAVSPASQPAVAQNYDAFSVSPQQLTERVDAATLQQLQAANAAVQRNPHDGAALDNRGALELKAAGMSRYPSIWIHAAAKDLEQALGINPNDFYARHNYAMACFKEGDITAGQPVMHLALTHFTKAIELKPDSARTYMGRGWAYLMLRDEAHAKPDFDRALQLDPNLRGELDREATAIREKTAQFGCGEAILEQMKQHVVVSNARTPGQCAAVKGWWNGSECRIATPGAGPVSVAHGNCAGPKDAVNHRYNERLGGYVVR